MSVFIQIFLVSSVRRFDLGEVGVLSVQGHPRSKNLVPIESAGSTSYQSVIVTLVLSCTVSELEDVLCATYPPHSTLILGVFPLHQIAHVGRQPEQRP